MAPAFKKENLRRILTEYAAAHAKGGHLPPLRTISLDLGVSVYLIRKAFDAMQKDGILYTRNRVGMFLAENTTPQQTVGLIMGNGGRDDHIDSSGACAGAIYALGSDFYQIRNLICPDLTRLPGICRKMGLAGVMCINASGKDALLLQEQIRKNSVSAVMVSEDLLQTCPDIRVSNIIAKDYWNKARMRSDFFAAHGKKHVLYYASRNKSLEIVRERLAQHHIELHPECVIHSTEDFERKAESLIRKHDIDGILCDGLMGFYETLFAFLDRHRGYHPLLSLSDNPRVRRLCDRYPEVKVTFQFEPDIRFAFQMGVHAVAMLTRSIQGPRLQEAEIDLPEAVDPVYIKWAKKNENLKKVLLKNQRDK